jgi:hypothetical protein
MTKKKTFNNNYIGVVGDGQAVLQINNKSSSTKKDTAKPTEVILFTEDKEQNKIAAWGTTNKFPQELLADVRKNGAATSGLNAVRDNHYGGGFILFKEKYEEDKNGDTKRKLVQQSFLQHPEINTFFKSNQMKTFFKESIADLEYFAIAFPEYVTSNDYNAINEIYRQKSAQCRFELMDEKTGVIKNVWISTKWHKKADLTEGTFAKPVRYINPAWSSETVKDYCKKHKITRFIRPVHYPMLDENYYPVAPWHSAYYSKWIHVSNSIPEFKKALFENQSTIKYHIEVDNDYFKSKYEDAWEDFSVDEKETVRKEFVDFIDSSLRDTKNTGKSIWSMIYRDDEGKEIPGLKITAIDDKLKDGAFLPDGVVANDEILSAISVDGCIISSGQVGGIGAGSGSDKRVAWDILSARAIPKREYYLSPFEFIQQYNGWDETLVGAFQNTQITTLDVNPTGTKKTANV